DINGDGKADIITAPASNGVPLVNVYDGASGRLIRSFYAYTPNFHGGATVASADVNDDGHADIITGTGFGGVPLVNIFSGTNNTLLGNFYAFDPRFRGGVVLAAGDMEGNGHADIVVGVGFGGNGNIRVFSGTTLTQRFETYVGYPDGASIALTDYDGDGLPDLVTSHKLYPGGLSGGGIFKGIDFTVLGGWGNITGFEQSGPTGDLISGWTAPP
ncbi:MAG TPA: VCBS repeat-containing protein, partial [Phycisphaerae bacterium]|nr:VCBS repeat-containing protein [Phycisphaerae bacterium]